jgi:Holliday junction DNA helicase RuvA
MYEYINGRLDYITADYIVVDVNGIGYRIFTSKNTISELEHGISVKIYTHLVVKEDDLLLYGFYTRDELSMFILLTSVSGVGPRAGVSLLSQNKPADIAGAIIGKDTGKLTKAPGIGKKIAERIILELKDKIDVESAIIGSSMPIQTDDISQVIEALISLGYNYNAASTAVAKLKDTNKSLEQLIKDALRML